MLLNNQIEATREQFRNLVHNYPKGQPVVMINILKYKEKVDGSDETGQESYMRYGKNMAPLLEKHGGKIIWMGKVNHTIIGDDSDQPHTIALVEWPDIQNFIDMSTSPEYQPIAPDRVQALAYGGLLASSTIMGDLGGSK
ncbi:MAG: DUF1330 domain-containing protein [Saprospiraceae bacterium]